MPPPGGWGDDAGDVPGIDPDFLLRFEYYREWLWRNYGIVTRIEDGFRSTLLQITRRIQNCGPTQFDIWQKSPSACRPVTALPGTSKHEKGQAIDQWPHWDSHWAILVAANMAGLEFDVPSERWHIVPKWSNNRPVPLLRDLPAIFGFTLGGGDAPTTPARKVLTKMIDFARRSNGQGVRVLLSHDGKPFYSWQDGTPGNWGAFVPKFACPLYGGIFHNVSPANDPGAFDNIGVEVNDGDLMTVQAFNFAFGGPDTDLWSCWESSPGGQFTEWVKIG